MTNARTAAILALAVAVGLLSRLLVPFEWVLVALYGLGVVMSGVFVLTWFPLAFRALKHHQRDVSLVRIIDYAGLQLVVFLAFLLILRTIVLYGISPPQDELAGVTRLILPVMLDVIIALRLWKWCRRLWEARHQGGPSDMLPEHVLRADRH